MSQVKPPPFAREQRNPDRSTDSREKVRHSQDSRDHDP
jgi:hypothetical protein